MYGVVKQLETREVLHIVFCDDLPQALQLAQSLNVH
jgi:hypothetical protein